MLLSDIMWNIQRKFCIIYTAIAKITERFFLFMRTALFYNPFVKGFPRCSIYNVLRAYRAPASCNSFFSIL